MNKEIIDERVKAELKSRIEVVLKDYQNGNIEDKVIAEIKQEELKVEEANKRSFYEKECINSNWSVRELERQISSLLYVPSKIEVGITNISFP